MDIRDAFVLLSALALTVVALRHKSLAQDLAEGLNNIFRGGPRPPTHPSPAADAVLLLRRRKKADL